MGLFRKKEKEGIEFKILNNDYFNYKYKLLNTFNKRAAKLFKKDLDALATKDYKGTVYLIKFRGDVVISNINVFKEKITALLNIANKGDTCIFAIESQGGTVTSYGELAYELSRIRNAGIKLITTVDQVAASGGYMLAVQGDQICAAPNAVIGSIGVIVSMPNYHEALNKIGVKYFDYMAGKNKRPITPYNEPTKEGEEHLQEELVKVHQMFKNMVKERRPDIDIDLVAEGNTYFGNEALELKMIDQFITTNELTFNFIHSEYLTIEIKHKQKEKKKFIHKFVASIFDELEKRILKIINQRQF